MKRQIRLLGLLYILLGCINFVYFTPLLWFYHKWARTQSFADSYTASTLFYVIGVYFISIMTILIGIRIRKMARWSWQIGIIWTCGLIGVGTIFLQNKEYVFGVLSLAIVIYAFVILLSRNSIDLFKAATARKGD
jgi:hypothetical protein